MIIGKSRIGILPRIGMRGSNNILEISGNALLRSRLLMAALAGNSHLSQRSLMAALEGSGLLSERLVMDALTGNADLLRVLMLHGNANLMKQFTSTLPGNALLSERHLLDALTGDSLLSERGLLAALTGNATLYIQPTMSLPGNALLCIPGLLMPPLAGSGLLSERGLLAALEGSALLRESDLTMDALLGNALVAVRTAKTLLGSAELFKVGYFELGGLDLSGHLYDPRNSGGGLRASSQRIPGSRKLFLQDEGQNESEKVFTLAWNRAVDKETFHRYVADGAEDQELFWGRSDRYFRIKFVSLPPTKDIDEPWKRVYLQDVICKVEDQSLYFCRNEADHPGLSVLPFTTTSITNRGTLESPICFSIQGYYSSGQVTSVYVKLMNSTTEERSLYIAPQLLSLEAAALSLDGAIKYYLTHTYADLYTNSTAYGRDATANGATWNSGGHISVPSSAYYQYRFRGNPLVENIILDATITVSAGSPLIQFSSDGTTWTTAVSAPEILSGALKRYYITGSEKYTDAYVRFYSPAGASMTVQDVSFSLKRDISGYYNQIPVIPAGQSRQMKVTGSGSARAYIYPDFRSRWQP
jgi:hypothetical protein